MGKDHAKVVSCCVLFRSPPQRFQPSEERPLVENISASNSAIQCTRPHARHDLILPADKSG